MVKHRVGESPTVGLAAWVMLASTVVLLPAAIAGAPSAVPGLGPLVAVIALGGLGTGVAFVILYDLIASAGPARTWIVSYLAPGFAVVYGAVLLGEEISAATLVGLALILVGSWLAAEGRSPFRLGRRRVGPAAQRRRSGAAQ